MAHAAIVAEGLTKSFTKRTGPFKSKASVKEVLKGVSFRMEMGETYGLLGANGSGKSTLVRLLSTLLAPDRGRALVLGHEVPGEESALRNKIGRVSADAAFYKKLSARENLLYSAMLYGMRPAVAERRALAILERLGLESGRFRDPLEEMSRGMQQKISIARALLVNPPLLLLDEPTTGLDPKSRRDVHLFLTELRREHGTSILLTTHDMPEAERLSDRIGFIAGGRIVKEGTAAELKSYAGGSLEDAFLLLSGCSPSEFERAERELI